MHFLLQYTAKRSDIAIYGALEVLCRMFIPIDIFVFAVVKRIRVIS